MLHFPTKTEIILDSLQARIKQISVVADSLFKHESSHRNYLELYKEISLYIHAIMAQLETRSLFVALVGYKKDLYKDRKFIELILKIENNVSGFANLLMEHPEYERLVDESKYSYANPNLSFSNPSIRIDILLKNLQNFKISQVDDDKSILRIGGILERVLAECGQLQMNSLDVVLKKINELHESINHFEFYNDFNCDFIGSSSANKLALIYSGFNPIMTFNGDLEQSFLLDNISKGVTISGNENLEILLNDCDKVFQYIKQQINSQLSIESYVDRFTTYISLYYKPDFRSNNAEVDLQNKFQEFIFNAGYYPISEAELNNGRLDTLASNETNAFLFELKQFDLGGKKEKNEDLITKIRSAQVQSSVYVDRLKAFPNLAHYVFILVFTNRKLTFKDSIDRIKRNDITYIVKPITVYEVTPSNVKLDVEVAIEDIIKYK